MQHQPQPVAYQPFFSVLYYKPYWERKSSKSTNKRLKNACTIHRKKHQKCPVECPTRVIEMQEKIKEITNSNANNGS